MNVTLLDFIAAGLVIALGSTLQASTGLGAGLIVVPLLALIHLEFVPGPVIFASLGLSLLMTLVGRDAIKRVHLHTVSIGLINWHADRGRQPVSVGTPSSWGDVWPVDLARRVLDRTRHKIAIHDAQLPDRRSGVGLYGHDSRRGRPNTGVTLPI